ncbi:[protein-PII] uridylyltransferase [Calidifontibacter terrae]
MSTDHAAQRLDLAGTREFALTDSGPHRRARLRSYAMGVLGELWTEAIAPLGRRADDGIALAAVGSLGRGDAGPLSDFDLILLHDGRTNSAADIARVADAIWYPLWDSGIRLDHSVRTLGECRRVASADLSATVGMLDIEPVAGDAVLVAGVRNGIAHDWRSNARQRLPELVDSLRARHERNGDLSTSLEPDLKEARGGLRDMAVLRAVTAAWLADRPHGDVDTAYARLLDVRDALHVATGRGRERLNLEDQDAVTALLGLPDGDALLTDVVQAGRRISHALDGTLRRATQSQRARTPRIGPRRPVLSPLGFGLYEHDGEVVLGPNVTPTESDHLLLLRAARVAARSGIPLSPSTINNLTRTLRPLHGQWPEVLRDAFLDLLATGPGLVGVWESLDLAGVVEQWIPEWRAVRSRPQRNGVHRFTVDRHLVETVVQAYDHRGDVARPDLLLLVALLHDIGKIAGVMDHAVEGAPVAATIARRMGMAPQDVDVVERLVREHLTLVELATRRDPTDPGTVAALLQAVDGRNDLLEQLAALTEADAIAAGPKAWTPWRSNLVAELVDRARTALRDGEVLPAPEPVAEDNALVEAVTASVLGGASFVQITATAGGAEVVLGDRDRLGLFADSAGLLASFGLLVRSARLHTVGGIAVDVWTIEAPHGDLPREEELARALHRLAGGDRTPLRALELRRRVLQPIGSPPPRATIVHGASADATVIEVRSPDRPGLLRDIGLAIGREGLTVRSAHVATYAGQTLDTFYVIRDSGEPVHPHEAAGLIGAVIDACH